MQRLVRYVGVIMAAAVGLGVHTERPEPATRQDQRWAGAVTVHWDAATDATVVTLDTDGDLGVDAAWRLQRSGPVPDYRGAATINFDGVSLAIHTPDAGNWDFVVRGRAPLGVDSVATASIPVLGLAHFPDPPAEDADVVVRLLLDGLCPVALVLEDALDCGTCEEGGQGELSCRAPADGTCSVTCGDGSYACCNAPNSCRCCEPIEVTPAPACGGGL